MLFLNCMLGLMGFCMADRCCCEGLEELAVGGSGGSSV